MGLFMYRLVSFVVNTCLTGLDWLWLICNGISVLIPFLLVTVLILCIVSRFIRLRGPPEDLVTKLLYKDEHKCQKYPVANQAANLDAPENSLSAIKMVIKFYLDSYLGSYLIPPTPSFITVLETQMPLDSAKSRDPGR